MRSAAALAAAAGLALACAHAPAPAPLPPAIPGEPPAADARLVLIGDAGVEADRPSALEAARAWVDANPAGTTVVVLGDNYYPRRRALLAEVFARQRAVGGAASTTVFVPGNHDWHPSGARLTSRVDPERLLAIAAGSGARWLPADGSFGPAALERDAFRVVAIDKRFHREGMSAEIIGAYDPLKKDKNLELDATKVESWVNRGAQISGGRASLSKMISPQNLAIAASAVASPCSLRP